MWEFSAASYSTSSTNPSAHTMLEVAAAIAV